MTTNGKNLYSFGHFLLTTRVGEFGEGKTKNSWEGIMEKMAKKCNGGRSGRSREQARIKIKRVKKGENCFNESSLQASLRRLSYDIPKVIAEIMLIVRVYEKRIAASVIAWLSEQAKQYTEAKELLSFYNEQKVVPS